MSVVQVVSDVFCVVGAVEGVLAVVGAKSGLCQKIVSLLKVVVGLEKPVEAVAADPSVATVIEEAPQVVSAVQSVVADVEKK